MRSGYLEFSARRKGFPLWTRNRLSVVSTLDQCGDDVSMGRITEFHDHDVSLDDMGIDHRVAAYLKRERSGIFRELERVFIDRYATIGLLLLIRWIARRNHAQQG